MTTNALAPAVDTEDRVGARQPFALAIIAIAGTYVSQTMVSTVAMQSVPTLLREAGYSLHLVSMSSLFMLPWILKFLWAPQIERLRLPPNGVNRRSRPIILAGHGLLIASLLGLYFLYDDFHGTKQVHEYWLLGGLIAAALVAATIDIACDGMAVDLLPGRLRGWANVAQVGGGYAGVMLGSMGVLVIAHRYGNQSALLAISAYLLILTLPTLWLREPQRREPSYSHIPSLRYALGRREVRLGLLLALLLGAGTRTGTNMIGPLLIDRGLSVEQVGWLLGLASVISGLLGTIVGGVSVRRWGVPAMVPRIVAVQAIALSALGWFSDGASLAVMTSLVVFKAAVTAAGFVAIYTLLMNLSSPKQAGVDFTVFQCADATVALLGGMVGGWLAAVGGYALCFGFAAVLAAVAASIVWRWFAQGNLSA